MSSVVTVNRNGLLNTVKVGDNESLLDAMINADIDPPYSCMSGTCGTCKAQLCSGQVEMDSHLALSDGDVAAGQILCCQAKAITSEISIKYEP